MAKSRNSFNSLMSQLAGSNSRPSVSGTSSTAGMKSNGLALTSLSNLTHLREIQFGKASQSAVDPKSSTSSGMPALVRAATGSASGLAYNLLGSGGLGSLVSGLFSLFGGGKSTPHPLTPFQLPDSVQQQLSVGSNTASSQAGSGSTGAYGSLPDQNSGSQWLLQQNQQIANAVKAALLQSSSLADVINEL